MTSLPDIIPREPGFRFEDLPRYWHGQRPGPTALFNAVSLLFPDGEAFFIESVKAVRGRIADPKLDADVTAFIVQESIHRREHARYNALLERQGFPVRFLAKRSRMTWQRRVLSAKQQVALTAAMEHYTAVNSRLILEDPRVLAGADPTFARLWRWHALEEIEHRALGFDVYKAVASPGLRGYLTRIAMFVVASSLFTLGVLGNIGMLLKADGLFWSWRAWGGVWRFIFWSPAMLPRVTLAYLAYFKPGFHPNDHDVAGLIARARHEFEADAIPAMRPAAAE